MMDFDASLLVRENIRNMKPYSTAREEFSGEAAVFLDANENAFGSPLPAAFNRYPDPYQLELKKKIGSIKGLPAQNIFLGNGSDEAIDLLFRIFCEPGKDNAIIFPPTYGMYEVSAATNDVLLKEIALTNMFQIDLETLESAIDDRTKLIFICSPNNPTGNSIDRESVLMILNNFNGIVVVDEAYINYSRQRSFIAELTEYPNLVLLQTFSKAWGLAALRLGMAFASQVIIDYFNKVKYPYNIGLATQQLALQALDQVSTINEWTRQTVEQREWLAAELQRAPFTKTVFPSDANFLLVRIDQAHELWHYLVVKGIIVRDRSRVSLCEDCLRITIGTMNENQQLLEAIKSFYA